jgi:hypothetical protein
MSDEKKQLPVVTDGRLGCEGLLHKVRIITESTNPTTGVTDTAELVFVGPFKDNRYLEEGATFKERRYTMTFTRDWNEP